jgi:hypothetical protein
MFGCHYEKLPDRLTLLFSSVLSTWWNSTQGKLIKITQVCQRLIITKLMPVIFSFPLRFCSFGFYILIEYVFSVIRIVEYVFL